ncbi:MAG: DASS family sodium-coupled anion symporter [Actinomycetota bacterium]|nr:DASS family sodium-coupled anion symporter [Actinomycetota bacterium]
MSTRRLVGVGAAIAWMVLALALDIDDLSPEGQRMLAIFGAAVVLWVTEAVPLFATAVLIIFAEIVLVSDEALLPLSDGYEAPPFSSFYAALAHPVLMLFLGGFFLADAAAKFRLDRNLAGVMLRPFSRSPAALIGGLMLITALLSMFMSNTATTAAMMAVVVPVAATLDAADPLRRALALSIPVAANIGGLGTPVGTPPNAIALGQLADEGIRIDFLQWMLLAVPIVLVVLGITWVVVVRRYPAQAEGVDLHIGGAFDRSRPAVILYATFAATVALWLSEPLHGIPSTIVGFVPVVVLLSTGVFTVDDLRRLNWHVLWLVGGGIALGAGVAETGLDTWLVDLVDWSALPQMALVAGLVVFALAMSTVISNSATANLLIPIGVTLAVSGAVDLEPAFAGVVIAVACSLAMALPVSTPPNAVAYATGMVETRDLAAVGLVVGAVGSLLVIFVAPPLWDALGLLP